MRNLRTVAALGLLSAAAAANAEVSSTWTLTNDYDFRGNSQTAKDPAVQASLDYAAESGWYIGGWASNVDFGDETDYEVDVYTGFSGGSEEGLAWDAGLVYYTYDESDYNYPEIYAGVTYQWLEGKIWYSNAFGGNAAEDLARENVGNDNVSAWYVEGNLTVPLPADFSLLVHAGLSTGDYWDNVAGDDIIDYSVGIGYTLNHFDLGLKYVDTSAGDAEVRDDLFNNEGRAIFTISTTFPWGD
jgi:uncharacterized protein (TIGR02001 family)